MLRLHRITGQTTKKVSNCSKRASLNKRKAELSYPEEQFSLIIMDTFKEQDNDEVKALCKENGCELFIVPHNLTNKSQPLDISSLTRGMQKGLAVNCHVVSRRLMSKFP